jgi:uncharacterized lipoprotein NlpE involved in copper resistance
MKHILFTLLVVIALIGCNNKKEEGAPKTSIHTDTANTATASTPSNK